MDDSYDEARSVILTENDINRGIEFLRFPVGYCDCRSKPDSFIDGCDESSSGNEHRINAELQVLVQFI